MSVGVARQWLGRLGKVDNGQVAVFGVLGKDRLAVPVDVRLYLPKKWIEERIPYPLLSCSDIEELLSHFLPRRDVSKAEVIRQLEDRHRRRQAAIEAHTRKQRKRVQQNS